MNKVFIVMENSLIECEDDFVILGVYDTREKAVAKWKENIEKIKQDNFIKKHFLGRTDCTIEELPENYLIYNKNGDYCETWYAEQIVK